MYVAKVLQNKNIRQNSLFFNALLVSEENQCFPDWVSGGCVMLVYVATSECGMLCWCHVPCAVFAPPLCGSRALLCVTPLAAPFCPAAHFRDESDDERQVSIVIWQRGQGHFRFTGREECFNDADLSIVLVQPKPILARPFAPSLTCQSWSSVQHHTNAP